MILESAVMKKSEAGSWQQQRIYVWFREVERMRGGGMMEPGFAWAVYILAGAVSRMCKCFL
jgi:hypothetical protein